MAIFPTDVAAVISPVVEPDLELRARPANASRTKSALWLLPVLPWLWYLVRSLFAAMDLVAVALCLLYTSDAADE